MAKENEETKPNFSFPFVSIARLMHSPDHHVSGMATPPIQTLAASVPFKWEEQPGKPRPCTDIIAIPQRLELELPPCSRIIDKMPSPTAVLDGPYNLGRPKFYSFRFFKASFDSSSNSASPEGSSDVDVLLGQKTRKKWFYKLRNGRKGAAGGGSFGFSHTGNSGDETWKMRRSGSFSGGSRSTHLSWAAVYQSLKQVIPWKSIGKSKKDGSV